ncbi:calcium-translocating P-type ATPase, PMCA-type [Scatolibacter rhodanostii]|uniref:calcium-translocating P-type ATPase, PMCA-type n=1 Tax=Scatolibacter rhodanostii TaxID=2014781 RepID=UPI001FA90DB6|nr:calcium-translocating P-type ATPase, PMCA-type [Scatolibacter rhodanostii]
MDFHSMTSHETVAALHTDIKKGLSRSEVIKRQEKYGKNEITSHKKQSIISRFFAQFQDFMIIILLTAATISFILSVVQKNTEYIDSIIILLIVVANAIIGTVQEVKADKAIEALKKMSSPHATVIRDGKKETVESTTLVPGDLVVIRTGDLVPADIRLIKSVELKAEESALTGESVPTNKDAESIESNNASLAERKNMIFAATGIASGSGVGIVTTTGMQTAMGNIAGMLNEEEAPDTPLQEKLVSVGKFLGIGVLAICAIIFILGLFQKIDALEMFMISISLAVAAIPEGLPAVVTIVLAIGVKRMAQRRAIIRHMPAVETLGSTQVICSDKTGTLTQNKMTVTRFSQAKGEVQLESREAQFALQLAVLCNNSELINGKITGDPTETAFLHACQTTKTDLEKEFARVGEIPFTSQRKMMTTAHKLDNGHRIISKGAPDILLGKCSFYLEQGQILPLTSTIKAKILQQNERMAMKALRVLAVSYKDVSTLSSQDTETEKALIFSGLIGMEDPPRKGVKHAVEVCKKAGILPVMITGDHAVTALAIGQRLGIAAGKSGIMTGTELDSTGDSELAAKIFDYQIFARVSPEHKVRIVKAFQKRGMVVAMTGDGVNDAPALKVADIGCAMGQNGTEVAKSAADMILTDDDFSTIVSAVKEGRGIYKNIRKTIHFLISCNIGEIFLIFISFMMRIPTPLVAIQLLWVNLVTDSLPALALGADPIENEVMKDKPHSKNEGVFSDGLGFSVIAEGCLIGVLALLAYTMGRLWFDINPMDPIVGRTMAFAVLSFSQLTHSFNMRSDSSIFKIGVFSNRKLVIACIVCAILMASVITIQPLTVIFKTVSLNLVQWGIVTMLSLFPIIAVEAEKLLIQILNKK